MDSFWGKRIWDAWREIQVTDTYFDFAVNSADFKGEDKHMLRVVLSVGIRKKKVEIAILW